MLSFRRMTKGLRRLARSSESGRGPWLVRYAPCAAPLPTIFLALASPGLAGGGIGCIRNCMTSKARRWVGF